MALNAAAAWRTSSGPSSGTCGANPPCATVVAAADHGAPVARVPLSALAQREQKPAVWVLSVPDDRLELRPVTVAAYAGDLALIGGGLKDGERVVTAGVHKLDAGQKVRVWTEPAR